MRMWTWSVLPTRPIYLHRNHLGRIVGKLSSKLKMPYNAI